MKIIAIKKDNVWYLKHPQHYYSDSSWENIRINGIPAIQCPDPLWGSCLESPETIERLITPTPRLVGYKRKEERADLNIDCPMAVPPKCFAYNDEDRRHQEYWPFYEKVEEDQDPYWEKLDWEIELIDNDCEPFKMTLPVTIDFPNDIAKHKEVHHKYPCYISSENLTKYLTKIIMDKIGESNYLKWSGYENLGIIRVERKISLYKPKTIKKDISGIFSKKPKWVENKITEQWEKEIELYSQSYKTNYYVDRAPMIKAENYQELEKKVSEFTGQIMSRLEDVKISECLHCCGKGYIRED